jgi:hypothetical protein
MFCSLRHKGMTDHFQVLDREEKNTKTKAFRMGGKALGIK